MGRTGIATMLLQPTPSSSSAATISATKWTAAAKEDSRVDPVARAAMRRLRRGEA